LLFAAPAGLIAAISAFTSYAVALWLGEPVESAQSAATVTLFIVTIAVLAQAARPLDALRLGVIATMILLFLVVLYVPFLSNFFALSLGPERYAFVSIAVGAIGAAAVSIAGVVTDRWRRA
jgi:cation-transporting ATPase E